MGSSASRDEPAIQGSSDAPRLTLILGIITGSLFLLGVFLGFKAPVIFCLGLAGSVATLLFSVAAIAKTVTLKLGMQEIIYIAVGLTMAIGPPALLAVLHFCFAIGA